MPAAASGRRPPPVTLRDFLELGCESSSDGFRSYPRYHHPRDDGGGVFHAPPPARPHDVVGGVLRRSPSRSPSAFLFFPKSPGALARISRSFSRRISFWRRRDEYDDDDLDDGRDSCGFPSPLVSSCSASSSEQGDDIVIEAATSSSSAAPLSEEASASSADRDCTDDVPGAAGDGHKQMQVQARVDDDGDPAAAAVGRGSKLETDPEEDKQHRSPVSVLDFPYDDDEEERSSDAGTCSSPASSSFPHHHCSLAAHHDLQKNKKAHKVRRRIDDGPTTTDATLDLEARFTTASDSGVSAVTDDAHHLPSNTCSSSSTDDGRGEAAKATTAKRHDDYEEHQTSFDDDERCEGQDAEEPDDDDDESYRLLARLLDDAAASGAAVDEISEWLLLDFLAEGIAHLRSRTGPVLGTTANKNKPLDDGDGKVTAALVEPAMEWLRGAGPQWSVRDVMFSGESALKDMERSRRWMCVREEEQDVGAEVEAFVMDTLLDELVTDLAR